MLEGWISVGGIVKFALKIVSFALVSISARAQIQVPPATNCPAPAFLKFVLQRTITRSELGYTEGLIFDKGRLLESTGSPDSRSVPHSIRSTSKQGKYRIADTPQNAFGEGLTKVGSELVQLTYTEKKLFVYDANTFQLKTVAPNVFSEQGWGLTTIDSDTLLASDGSEKLYFLDAKTFAVKKILSVMMIDQKLPDINHLQKVGDFVFANLFQPQYFFLLRIDLNTGCVNGMVDVSPLVKGLSKKDLVNIVIYPGLVLNGVAYDPATGQFFVTGKDWSKIFVIKLKP